MFLFIHEMFFSLNQGQIIFAYIVHLTVHYTVYYLHVYKPKQ